MKKILVLLLVLSPAAFASEPDRASLIAAWEAYVRGMPSTAKLESLGGDRYEFSDTELEFDGELRINGVLIRAHETYGVDTEFSHFGMIELELVDLPPEQLGTYLYSYWLADRQTLHYSTEREGWVDPKAYQQSFTSPGSVTGSWSLLMFMLDYGIWILLVALIISVFVFLNRQQRKSKSLMDDSEDINKMARENIERANRLQEETADINKMARENLERAERMQGEVIDIARGLHEMQKQSNELLERIAKATENRS